MKLTNKLHLPQPIVKAVANDSYDAGDCDISVTALLKPPQMVALERIHREDLTEDVSNHIWSLLGQLMHGLLERAEETAIAERRLTVDILGWKVSGQMDRFLLKEGVLQDYKFTTVYKTRDGVPDEFIKQLNMYASMLREHGETVKKLEIVAFYRDWSKRAVLREEHYPTAQVEVLGVPIIDHATVRKFMEERVALFQAAKQGVYPPCTAEERWARPDTYAVKKVGMDRAVRVCNSREAAELILAEKGKGHSIEFRPGESIRCEDYCNVSRFCQQYRATLGNQEKK